MPFEGHIRSSLWSMWASGLLLLLTMVSLWVSDLGWLERSVLIGLLVAGFLLSQTVFRSRHRYTHFAVLDPSQPSHWKLTQLETLSLRGQQSVATHHQTGILKGIHATPWVIRLEFGIAVDTASKSMGRGGAENRLAPRATPALVIWRDQVSAADWRRLRVYGRYFTPMPEKFT